MSKHIVSLPSSKGVQSESSRICSCKPSILADLPTQAEAIRRKKARLAAAREQLEKSFYKYAGMVSFESYQRYGNDEQAAAEAIDRENFAFMLSDMGAPIKGEEFDSIFNAIDADGGGDIDVDEFCDYFLSETGDDMMAYLMARSAIAIAESAVEHAKDQWIKAEQANIVQSGQKLTQK